jgi:hypothetical protein
VLFARAGTGSPLARCALCDGGIGVEDLVDPLRRGGGLLARGQDVAHRLDRPHHLQGQRDERDQAAEAQLVPADRERAEQQDHADHGVGQQVEAGPECAAQPCLLHLRLLHERGLGAVLLCRLVAPAERLEHPDAGRGLLDVCGEVALLVLGAAGQDPVPPLETGAQPHDREEHAPGEQPEPPVQPDQQRDDGHERHHVGDEEDRAETGEAPDRGEVGSRAGQQLAGLPVVVEPGVQALQMRVEGIAHRLFQVGDRAGLHPPPVEV